ncbi:hypothetical protein ScPMuIL_005603 [Solemya velum]
MAFTVVENLRGFASSRPPLVVFMICLGAFAVVLLTMAYIVNVKDRLADPDYKADWNTFLENFADVEFCLLGNNSGSAYTVEMSQKEDPSIKKTIDKLHTSLQDKIGSLGRTDSNSTTKSREDANEMSSHDRIGSITTSSPSDIVNVSVTMMVDLKPTFDFLSIPHNVTYLTTSMTGKQLGLEGDASDLEMNVTLTLPFSWNSSRCQDQEDCPLVRILTCVTFQAPASFFPRSRRPETCSSSNETGVEYHSRMMGYPKKTESPYSAYVCHRKPLLRVSYKLNPNLTMMLSMHDKSIINLHLMHTSYFLFVMFVTVFCYALFKGKSMKLKSRPYTEVSTA